MSAAKKLSRKEFWIPLSGKYPKGIEVFNKWFESYKRDNDWYSLFSMYTPFFDLPDDIQVGIWLKFVGEQDKPLWSFVDPVNYSWETGITQQCRILHERAVAQEKLYSEGIIPKYKIQKADGSPIDPGAEYFVLRLDDGGSDKIHIRACRDAVLMYATMIQNHLPALSKELFDKYGPATFPPPPKDFTEALTRLINQSINQYSKENESNTPDFILACYMLGCLSSFTGAVGEREKWWQQLDKPVENAKEATTGGFDPSDDLPYPF